MTSKGIIMLPRNKCELKHSLNQFKNLTKGREYKLAHNARCLCIKRYQYKTKVFTPSVIIEGVNVERLLVKLFSVKCSVKNQGQ